MCDRPLKGFQKREYDHVKHIWKPKYTKNGKPDYCICSPEVNYIWYDKYGNLHKSFDFNRSDFITCADVVKDYILIPCGSCVSCRVARAGELADRCMLEMKYHDTACFVTFTYDDDHLIAYNYTRTDTGETGRAATLFKKHYQDFFKRLRKAYPNSDVRYVLCGEYGEHTDRPHYHGIIFGYRPSDLTVVSRNHHGQYLYMSEELNRLWRQGNCIIGEVTKDSANYVARYVTKKLYAELGKEHYENIGRIQPFIVSSKRPAIGKRWYDDNKDWCFEHQISYPTDNGGRSFNAPRYFKKLRDKEGISRYNVIEDIRNAVNVSRFDHMRDLNNQTYTEQADAKARVAEARNKAYMRDKI